MTGTWRSWGTAQSTLPGRRIGRSECEAIATAVMHDSGLPTVRTQVADVGDQRFLEVQRFDRAGHFGRRDSWTESARRLQFAGLLSEADARRVRLLDAFGARIGNTDRHFGNTSFFADGLCKHPRFKLAPAYDMQPMTYAKCA